ncbi:MAG: hypothetical protein Q8O04_03845 [Deltaproteobacteria bacterium]|nr:hypothetical protein [Deltaproteobacteria bacterium]
MGGIVGIQYRNGGLASGGDIINRMLAKIHDQDGGEFFGRENRLCERIRGYHYFVDNSGAVAQVVYGQKLGRWEAGKAERPKLQG